MGIPKSEGIDIEIYPAYKINIYKFSINLWDKRKGNNVIESDEVDSLNRLIMKIVEYFKKSSWKNKV